MKRVGSTFPSKITTPLHAFPWLHLIRGRGTEQKQKKYGEQNLTDDERREEHTGRKMRETNLVEIFGIPSNRQIITATFTNN